MASNRRWRDRLLFGAFFFALCNIFYLNYFTFKAPTQGPVYQDDIAWRKEANLAKLLNSLSDGFVNVEADFANNQSIRKGAVVDTLSHAGFDLAVVNRLLSTDDNRHFRFALAGGSISRGHGVPADKRYFSLVSGKLSGLLEPLGFRATFTDVSAGAITSLLYAGCIQEHLDLTAYDFILLEFTTNDILELEGGAIEELVRSIWRINPAIHIIYVQISSPAITFRIHPYFKIGQVRPHHGDVIRPHFLQVAKHYNIGFVTNGQYFFNLGYNRTMSRRTRTRTAAIYASSKNDLHHPGKRIHEFIAEGILSYLANSFRNMTWRIMQEEDVFTAMQKTNVSQWKKATVEPPIFETTWMDAAECFVSTNDPLEVNDKLLPTIDQSCSNSVALNASAKYYNIVGFVKSNETRKMHFCLEKRFVTNITTCPKGFIPRLALVHLTCGPSCANQSRAQFGVEARFQFHDRNVTIKYLFQSPSHKFSIRTTKFLSTKRNVRFYGKVPLNSNAVKFPLMPVNREEDKLLNLLCTRTNGSSFGQIKSVNITIQEIRKRGSDSYYPLKVHGIVIGYDCCP